MVDFNGIETILFLPKDAPKSLAAGAPAPETPLDELTAFPTLLVDGDEGKTVAPIGGGGRPVAPPRFS